MTSSGNDIVSLTGINVTRTKDPRFYSKIFSDAENQLFSGLENDILPFEHFVWMLWSVKEAAFKYLRRIDPGIMFTPVKFVVQQLQSPLNHTPAPLNAGEITGRDFNQMVIWDGMVSFENHALYSKTFICTGFISSVVNHSQNFDNVYWGIKQIENTDHNYQSAAVREFLIKKLQHVLGVDKLIIGKNVDDVPILLRGNEEMGVPVSLAHHECWVAYSFAYSP
jgi:phosphopantetheinyl transferase (holo-ACP synthase)